MRKLSSEENKKLAESLSIYYIETSSKTGNNVDNLFYKIVTDYQVINYQFLLLLLLKTKKIKSSNLCYLFILTLSLIKNVMKSTNHLIRVDR